MTFELVLIKSMQIRDKIKIIQKETEIEEEEEEERRRNKQELIAIEH